MIDFNQINIKLEREQAIENFQGYLTGYFYSDSEEMSDVVDLYNSVLIFLLMKDGSVKIALENALFNNNEYLTNDYIVVDGKKVDPLISNWLKDFISQKGSAMFNDITLTDYIAHSFNCQKLNDENRRLVRKLLILYRNLKFFPASMPNDTGVDWEIIPIDDKVHEFNRGALGVPKTAEEKNIDVLQAESRGYGADSLEKKVIEEEISNEKKIEGLRIMANRYPEGSLEWRALMDEVKKIQV